MNISPTAQLEVVWMLGFLLVLQGLIVFVSVYFWDHLEPRTKKAWPWFIYAQALICLRRILGSIRWQGFSNYIVLENLILFVITGCIAIFVYKSIKR
jgi:hypothetical protein